MNSRERVLAALRHQEADRVPIDLGAMRSTGIQAIAYNRLKAHLGIAGGETRLYDIMQQLAEPETAIVERFHLDALPLPRAAIGFDPTRPGWKPWRLPDLTPQPPSLPGKGESDAPLLAGEGLGERLGSGEGSGVRSGSGVRLTTVLIPDGLEQLPREDGRLEIRDDEGHILYHMPAGGMYYEPVYEPLAEATTVAEIEAWQPAIISDAELAWLAAEARQLRATSNRAILGQTGISIYEAAQRARGWQRFMTDLAGEPKLAEALLSRIAESAIASLARYLDAVGEYIDIVQVGDDLGTQAGQQLSPAMYRRLVKPYQKQVWRFIKARSGLPLFLHCCGGIYPLIPDLIEAGVDILNPVQISAAGMDPVRLKAEFGRDLVFWGGGCDTQHILPEASPAQVADHVRRQIEILAPGGGFVFNQVHNIQANVPPENVVAMLDAAWEHGSYDSGALKASYKHPERSPA